MDSLSGRVSLDYVVASVINTMRVDERNYVHLKQLAIEGYQELSLFHLNNVKVAYLAIEEGNVVTLPHDYQYYSKIGVLIGGRVHTLTKDDTIALPRDMKCGDEPPIAIIPPEDVSDPYNKRRMVRDVYTPFFGDVGGANVGYYRIDEERRVIALRGCTGAQELVLEYCNVPIVIGEDTMIDRYVVPALKAYVMWKSVQYDTRIKDQDKARREYDFQTEVYKLRTIVNQLTADEYKDIVNSTRKQTVKR